jgi:broad specificity phosphatase PhoE
MIVYLVRHGETIINKQSRFLGHFDVALSERGIEQAERVSTYLDGIGVTRVYSSDLKRAVQTAQVIARDKKNEVILRKSLRELDFGDWEGLTYDEIQSVDGDRFTAWLNDYESVKIPGGESWVDFSNRVVSCFEAIVNTMMEVDEKTLIKGVSGVMADGAEEKIAIVTHGGPIRLITSCLIDDKKHFESFWPTAGSVHMVELKRNEPFTEDIGGGDDLNLTPCRRLLYAYSLTDYYFNLQIS